MSGWLWASALLMGLAGGPHCLAMCGGACSALTMRCGGPRPQAALAAWQIGRLLAYSAAGAVVASSVSVLGEWGQALAWLRPWWVMLHLAAFALGLWMLWQGRAPLWMSGAVRLPAFAAAGHLPVARPQAPGLAFAMPGSRSTDDGMPPSAGAGAMASERPVLWMRAGAAGAAWVVLPCGLLQSALVVAALGNQAADGALVMACFALGSGLSLWIGPRLWSRLAAASRGSAWAGRLGPVQAVRLAGALLALASGWAIAHQMLVPWISALCA